MIASNSSLPCSEIEERSLGNVSLDGIPPENR